MDKQIVSSWGRVLKQEHNILYVQDRFVSPFQLPEKKDSFSNFFLPYGNGRSYGDSCLNDGGTLIKTTYLNRFIHFDTSTGLLTCEAGIFLSEILNIIVPQGWFLPVTPGTRFITLGGAIANDVHGKNHHKVGTFGRYVQCFELLRSDGNRYSCSPQNNQELFHATIGGLGLTGLITWASIQLRRIHNPWICTETIRYDSLDEFFDLCKESDNDYEYTVSWVDCLGRGKGLGRGLFMRGNHAPADITPPTYQAKNYIFPIVPPISLVNSFSLKIFNSCYYYKQTLKNEFCIKHYEPFFYPLDSILHWNRLYGSKGFYQYQCVIPIFVGREAITELLDAISRSGMGSFLSVLKICGPHRSPGMLSFPKEGISLALDFPNQGKALHHLFARLDNIVLNAGGRLYPAKDSRMPGSMFRSGYSNWKVFKRTIDPNFSSSFWRRMMEEL